MINDSPEGVFSSHAYYEKIRKSLCAIIVLISSYFLPPQERKTDEKKNLKDSSSKMQALWEIV